MKNVLVTGGAGFIASNLIKRLFKDVKGATIVNIDNMNARGDRGQAPVPSLISSKLHKWQLDYSRVRKKAFCAFNANINHNHNEKSDVECSVCAGIIDLYGGTGDRHLSPIWLSVS